VIMPELYVEVVPNPDLAGDLSPLDRLREEFSQRVHELGDSLTAVASELRERLAAGLADEPTGKWTLDEVEVAFSLDLQSEAGVVIARAAATAGFQATLRWKTS
jgi:hypothetical protein